MSDAGVVQNVVLWCVAATLCRIRKRSNNMICEFCIAITVASNAIYCISLVCTFTPL